MKYLKTFGCLVGILTLPSCGGTYYVFDPEATRPTPSSTPVSVVETYSLENGASSIDLTAKQTVPGKVYYAVYDTDPVSLSSNQVKNAAENGIGTNLVDHGVLDLPHADTEYSVSSSALPEKKLYYVYAVAESANGLSSTVKKYSRVLPNRMPELNFSKVTGAEAGQTMRQLVHLPKGYYDHPTQNYPVIVWIHGAGEASWDGTNTGVDFATMKIGGIFKLVYMNIDPMPAIIVGTQCNNTVMNCSSQGRSDLHKEGLDEVMSKFRTDSTRIYIMGLSWGGAGAISFAVNYPTIPAAVVPIATNASEAPMTLCNTIGANNIPVWAMLNDGDAIYGNNMSWAINGLRGCMSDVRTKPRLTYFTSGASGTWPNTIEQHASAENLALGLPFYDYGASKWKYWNGSAELADSDPPTHRTALAPEMINPSPGLSPGGPVQIQMDSLVTASNDLGVSIQSVWDWLNEYHR